MAAKATGGSCSWRRFIRKRTQSRSLLFSVRASHSMDDMDTVYKQLGLFSLKKKIKDVVLKAEMLAPDALEFEEEQWIKQEETMRYYDLWDDPAKSDEILLKLADREKAVDILKDLKYKAEEAKLIMQLGEMDAIEYSLFEQAYDSSLDVSRSLDHYEMSKLLRDQYDSEGACMIIKSGSQDTKSQIWTEQVLSMYIKWAEKLGQNARVAEKCTFLSNKIGVESAAIEFEFEFAYGYLLGEQGVHRLITSFTSNEDCSATVDIIPLFLRSSPDLDLKDDDLITLYPDEHMVRIQHIPSGITMESSGERNRFANRIKALNRLKAKLIVMAKEQKISDVSNMNSKKILEETRRMCSVGVFASCFPAKFHHRRKQSQIFTRDYLHNPRALAFKLAKSDNFASPFSHLPLLRSSTSLLSFVQTLARKVAILLFVGSSIFLGLRSSRPALALPTTTTVVSQAELEDEIMFEKLMESEPENIEAVKAVLYKKMRRGKTEDAVKYVEKLIQLEPHEIEWKLLEAFCYETLGQLSKAKRLFKDILKEQPLLIKALHGLAMVMHKTHGDDSSVFDMLMKALEVARQGNRVTEERNIQILIGQMHIVKGQFEEGLKIFQQMVNDNPRDFRPYLCQGIVYSLMGKKVEAAQQFEIYCSLVPEEFPQKGFLDDLALAARANRNMNLKSTVLLNGSEESTTKRRTS